MGNGKCEHERLNTKDCGWEAGDCLEFNKNKTTAIVKNNTSDFGKNVPTQYLEMIIPNGEQGDAGELGTTGMKGFPGTNGPNGTMGVVGNVLTLFND